jgi:outer membrane protein assembly factor BamA
MKSSSGRYFHIFSQYVLFTTGILTLLSFFSCNTVKKLHKGEYLLNNNKIIYRLGSSQKSTGFNIASQEIEQLEISPQISPSELLPYEKQKPNIRILFVIPFYLYLYNLPDSANTARAKARRDSAYVIKARRKGWTSEKLKRKMNRKTGREWIMSQGEAPVILDSSLTQKTTDQLKTFLFNKGYFNASVKDSIWYSGKKADVYYLIKPGKPYRIRNIEYFFEDPGLIAEVYSDTTDCKIRKNDIYDKDILDAERDRLTALLNNSGYYYFSKNYISYAFDTDSKAHLVDVEINIKKFARRDSNDKDSVIETAHAWFRIRHVIVEMQFDPVKSAFYKAEDTLNYDGLNIVYPRGKLSVKPSIFRPKIFVTPGDVYRAKNREDTYTGLSQLGVFSYISLKYVPIKDSNYVDCYIQLMPVLKHSVGAEFELTNTGGDFGTEGDVSYENYNQFKGAEKLQIKLNGGLIAQKALFSGAGSFLFNTEDLGPELDLAVPRPLFPFKLFHFARRVNPQTTIKLSFDYQLRLDYYTRRILGLSYAFDYDPVKNQHFTFALFEWNFVNANLSPDFVTLLEQYNQYFRNSFTNQVITDGRISWLYNTQNPSGRQKQFNYLKLNGEFSGLVLDFLEHFRIPVLHYPILRLPVDASGDYYIKQFDAPFSQYFKGDGEYRHYWILDKKQRIVVRGLAGLGYAYYNSTELPFTKSFWAGGSNDLRAWQIQTLGPGGSPSSVVAGQVGDIKLEGNWEYRVSLIKYFGIAIFNDFGNIWLMKNRATEGIPLAYMETSGPSPFWSEIAVDFGVGARFDFNYFVFRIDFGGLGAPLKDPSLPVGQRWLVGYDSFRRTILNIGIGYPF